MGVVLTPIVVEDTISLEDVEGTVEFLCRERAFGEARVRAAIERTFSAGT